MSELQRADCVNDTCPWSGDPVSADSLTTYKGHVVGFCNPGCRDRFEQAIGHFEAALGGVGGVGGVARGTETAR